LIYLVPGIVYLFTIGLFLYGWFRIKPFRTKLHRPVPVSVIVAVRNEEENIKTLLESIGRQDYPRHLVEVILVNDHSSDNTLEVLKEYTWVKVISLENKFGKKEAIKSGIENARNELIVTTDADCVLPVNWLATYAAYFEANKSRFQIPARIKVQYIFFSPAGWTPSRLLLPRDQEQSLK